jgi:hypothetical protein
MPQRMWLEHLPVPVSTAVAVASGGQSGECFRNALRPTVKTGLPYVEGYALAEGATPHLHAWNASPDGFVVDTTWEPIGRVYFGVIFPLSLVRRSQDSIPSVHDDWVKGYPVLRESFDIQLSRRR